MNRIRRLAAILAGLAGALLAVAAVAPAALGDPFPPRPPGWDKHPPLPPPDAGIHVVVVGGMPGWQIALIAIGAALLAATAAAGIIAKRGGSPVWRPRAKMSAPAPPAVRQEHPEPPDRHQPQGEPSVICPHGAGPAHVRSSPSGKNTGSRADRRPPMSTRIPRRGPYRPAAARQAGARLCRLAAVRSSATGEPGSSRWPCRCCSWSSSPWCSPTPPRSRAGRPAPRSTTSPASSRWRSSAPHSAIQVRVLDPYCYTLEVV